MKIEMIICPLCGSPICSAIGFACHNECVYGPKNCLQNKFNRARCECSHSTLHTYFKENYIFDKAYDLKQMVKLVATNNVQYIPKIFLEDDLFEI